MAVSERTRQARIDQRRSEVYPLEKFPQQKQEQIAQQVAAPTPPPRMICGELFAIPSRAWYEWHWARGIDPDGGREPIPASLRAAVIERDGFVCQLCDGEVEPGDIHLDHIKPYSKGGPTTLSNLQVTHSRCNLEKGARY